jgi:NAD(P)-dependent dehydrogenase (short-subunit alcohol dehydrogenase family)
MSAKRCLVIGGSGTVGRAVCVELAARGAKVAFSYCRGEASARALCDRISARAARLDVADPGSLGPALDGLVDGLGGIDAVVYCAAIASTHEPPRFDSLETVDAPGWRRLMAVNVDGAFLAVQALVPRFADAGGSIVLLGSIDGVKGVPTPIPYAVSKGALRSMALSLAKLLGPAKICVNVVSPGILDDGLSRVVPDELKREYLKHSALKRFGRAEEVAKVVAELALANSYVTGQTILLDGGL